MDSICDCVFETLVAAMNDMILMMGSFLITSPPKQSVYFVSI